jgi:hypothetical protein
MSVPPSRPTTREHPVEDETRLLYGYVDAYSMPGRNLVRHRKNKLKQQDAGSRTDKLTGPPTAVGIRLNYPIIPGPNNSGPSPAHSICQLPMPLIGGIVCCMYERRQPQLRLTDAIDSQEFDGSRHLVAFSLSAPASGPMGRRPRYPVCGSLAPSSAR